MTRSSQPLAIAITAISIALAISTIVSIQDSIIFERTLTKLSEKNAQLNIDIEDLYNLYGALAMYTYNLETSLGNEIDKTAMQAYTDAETKTSQALNIARSEIKTESENYKAYLDSVEPDSLRASKLTKNWENLMVRMVCVAPNSAKLQDPRKKGSGTLARLPDGSMAILTNKHVVTFNNETQTVAKYCDAVFEDNSTTTIKKEDFVLSEDFDSAILKIKDPTIFHVQRIDTFVACTERLDQGDRLITLGYPAIGAEEDLTVTDGIVAGFEDEYYITTAKIEKGNSGGAALSLSDQCYAGLPSFVKAGRIESLARILDIRYVFDTVSR